MSQKFPTGLIVATPGAISALQNARQEASQFLNRHIKGDWGDIQEEDRIENEKSLKNGFRLLSVYSANQGTTLWIITEADRSVTTLLLPDEY